MMRCITPERRTVISTLSPPPPPPGRNRNRLSKLEESAVIQFLPCNLSLQTSGASSSSSNVAMVATTTSEMNQILSRLTNKRIRCTNKPLKCRSMSEHASHQSKGPIELEDIVKSLPPPLLVAISMLKPDDDAMDNTLQQSQQDELLVQKNFMAKSA